MNYRQQLVDFSKKLDLDQLYQYIEQVHKSTKLLIEESNISRYEAKI